MSVTPLTSFVPAKTHYPMFVMSVATFMEIDGLLPDHQTMLRRGDLVPHDPDFMKDLTMFISHQWTSNAHADIAGTQLKTLQTVFRRLQAGEIDRVEADWKYQIATGGNKIVTAKQWKERLSKSFLWIDFCCIPQMSIALTEDLLKVVSKIGRTVSGDSFMSCFRSAQQETEAAAKLAADKAIAVAAKAHDTGTPVTKGGGGGSTSAASDGGNDDATTDHRHVSADTDGWKKINKIMLGKAVQSIPAYIERSSLIVVLVPPCKHADRKGEICDESSWRGRGWCRVEYLGATLVRSDVSVMVVEDALTTPLFVWPVDGLQLAPGHGTYTCCSRNHDFGDGPNTAECDLLSVAPVLSTMIDDKIDYLWSARKTFDARAFTALKPWLMRGLPTSEETDRGRATATIETNGGESKAESGSGDPSGAMGLSDQAEMWAAAGEEGSSVSTSSHQNAFQKRVNKMIKMNRVPNAFKSYRGKGEDRTSGGKSGLAAASALFRWRDDATEAAETKRTGVGLLFWSSVNDNVEAVLELAKKAKANKNGGRGNESNNAMRIHRPELFGYFLKGTTALHMAASFASWPLVEALLEMGAKPKTRTGNGVDSLMSMAWFGRAHNITRWCERFPTWNFSRRDGGGGYEAMGYAVGLGPNKLEAVKALVKAGANPLEFASRTGATYLHTVAANKDAGAELVRYLLQLPGVRALINTQMRSRTMEWKVKLLIVRILVKLGSKKAMLLNVNEWSKLTALITAARNGTTAVMKVLVEEGGADTQLRNARGHTALDMLVGGENALEETRVLLGGGE